MHRSRFLLLVHVVKGKEKERGLDRAKVDHKIKDEDLANPNS